MTNYRTLDRLLLPDDDTWGQGIASYTPEQLDEIAKNVGETSQPGYGARLHATTAGYVPGGIGGRRAVVPPGFDAVDHPNRAGLDLGSCDPDMATELGDQVQQLDPRLREYFAARGWVLDQHGRPLHPHHAQLLADDRIGMPTGLGYGWWTGETIVADAVVTTRSGHVLLIDRKTDSGVIPSIPGGYTIPADFGRSPSQWRTGDRPITIDGIITGAARRTAAETGLVMPRWTIPTLVRGIRPVSSPHTLCAWTMTITVRCHVDDGELPALDRSSTARWVYVDDVYRLIDDNVLWPDHQRAVLAAIE